MTTIYLIRHSKAKKNVFLGKFMAPLTKNKKVHLSKEGKDIAKIKLYDKEFDEIDVIYSSEYNRAYETAQFLAKRLNKKINIDKRLNERVHGIEKKYSELPDDFEKKQLVDENYKFFYGESQKEVYERMNEVLNKILKENSNKKIAIFTHSTSITFLLKKITNMHDDFYLYYNNKKYFSGDWKPVEIFKLIFNENNELIDIENILI